MAVAMHRMVVGLVPDLSLPFAFALTSIASMYGRSAAADCADFADPDAETLVVFQSVPPQPARTTASARRLTMRCMPYRNGTRVAGVEGTGGGSVRDLVNPNHERCRRAGSRRVGPD